MHLPPDYDSLEAVTARFARLNWKLGDRLPGSQQEEERRLIAKAERVVADRRHAQKLAWAQQVLSAENLGAALPPTTTDQVRAELKADGPRRWRVYERDNHTCQTCGATGKTVELTVDHIVPVIAGGTNDESNLQTLCRSCNSRKGARIA